MKKIKIAVLILSIFCVQRANPAQAYLKIEENNQMSLSQKFEEFGFIPNSPCEEDSPQIKASLLAKRAQNTELENILRLESAKELQLLGQNYQDIIISAYTSLAKNPTEIIYGSSDHYCGTEAAKFLMGISPEKGREAYLFSLENYKNDYYTQSDIINTLITFEDTSTLLKTLRNNFVDDDLKIEVIDYLIKRGCRSQTLENSILEMNKNSRTQIRSPKIKVLEG